MSSRQFNYYGSDTDWQIVESSIRDVLGPLAVFDKSGAAIELNPVESRRAMFVTDGHSGSSANTKRRWYKDLRRLHTQPRFRICARV